MRNLVPNREGVTELRANVINQRNTPPQCVGYAVDEWFGQADLEDSARNSYAGYISRVIRPVLGGVAVKKSASNWNRCTPGYAVAANVAIAGRSPSTRPSVTAFLPGHYFR